MIILKRPIVTEKTSSEYENSNKVTFEVSLNANKFNAIKALEDIYNVSVENAWVLNRLGKKRVNRITGKKEKKSRNMKIMKFKLKKGNKIDIFKT